MSTITRRRPVNSANTATTNKLNNAKEATTMKSTTTTIALHLDLANLTKAQKAALTTLGIAYKKPVEKKEPVKRSWASAQDRLPEMAYWYLKMTG